ncbi:hypothetical protein [Tritonibacter mobilis]|uniref:hypothetical protein n=1 Tax=Tritonibacter mobilis TaxID=379347 RepID=UPI0039A55168
MPSDIKRQVRGIFVTPAGEPVTNKTLTFFRSRRVVTPAGDSTVVDEPFFATTDGTGLLDKEMFAGNYLVLVKLSDVDRYFNMAVPDQPGPHNPVDLLDYADPGDPVLTQVQQLVLKARAWAENPEDVEVDPTGYPEEYSAKHYAMKSSAASAAAQGYAEQAEAATLVLPKTPQDFGASGDESAYDTQALKNWLESGGNLFAPAGTYLVEAEGDDAGGVLAIISESIHVVCSPEAIFKAENGLDNDILRIRCDAAGYSPTRHISVEWFGGRFDQRLQKTSTVVPYLAQFPAAVQGASATCDGLAIGGEVDDGGTPVAGFFKILVRDVQFLASDEHHWENSGGDSGLGISGARHIDVQGVTAFGSRDLAIYASGLTSGAIPGGSCYIAGNKFVGCMFGAATKRRLSNVQMVHNIGYNTAIVCGSSAVTETGDNVMISHNIGHGAWVVAAATGGAAVIAQGNQSFNHGHLMQDGSVPPTVFGDRNACVRLEGVEKSKTSDNHVIGLNTGITAQVCAVRLGDDAGTKCYENFVHGNTAEGVESVVIEDAGGADKTICYDNHGKNLSGQPVVLDGASSVDRDGPLYENNATQNHTGTTSSTSIDTATVKQGTMTRRDRLRVVAGGTIIGTAGGKTFGLKVGGAPNRSPPLFAATVDGNWHFEAVLEFNEVTSQRLTGAVVAGDAAGAIFSAENQDFLAGDVDISLIFKLEDIADSIVLRTFSVRME